MTEVLIAGAGPVGLTLAIELSRFGVPVRVLDRAPARTDKSKAVVVWPRTLELLDRAGLAAAFAETGLQASRVSMRAGGEPLAEIGFGELPTPYPYVLVIPQSETERLLEEHLSSLGVRVERGTELVEFAEAEEGVTCALRRPDGAAETARFGWLVGCDGARSTVRHGLGLEFEGDTLPLSFVLADVRVTGFPVPDDRLALIWSAEGPLLGFPMKGGRYRLIASIGEAPRHDPTLEEIQAIVDRRAPGARVADPAWLSGFAINERMVPRYRVGRVFVAGDAAHIHSPAGGQGMNTGMHDAINLAWKLALVVRGLAAPSLLDSYGAERSVVARRVLSDSGRMTRAATLRGGAARALRDFAIHTLLGFHGIRDAAAARLSELTVGYPESPLNLGSAAGATGPRPGERILAGAPFGAGETPRFALLAEEGAEARAILAAHPALLEAEPRPPLGDGLTRLVRPDGYVAAIASRGEGSVASRALAGIAAGSSPASRASGERA